MKKILIATACAVTLCFTGCASKQAPETDTQTQAPQTEITPTEAEENAQPAEESDENSSTDTENSSETEPDLSISSEDFPEPESIEEPEIITLEPVEEPLPSEAEDTSEKVENEEPPVITDSEINTDAAASENQTTTDSSAIPDKEEAEAVVTGPTDSDNDEITSVGGGIDITDDDSDSGEQYREEAENIVPSRSVKLKKFEYLDITYPGTGWIYMGITDNSKDIAYFGRKLGTKDTKFSLQARAAGTKIVHFYRNDPLTGHYLDDYIEVIILPENGSNKTHIEAPEYKLPVQKKETPVKKTEEPEQKPEEAEKAPAPKAAEPAVKPAVKQTAPETKKAPAPEKTVEPEKYEETAAPASEPVKTEPAKDSSTLLKEAQVLYNEKEYATALKKLNQFIEYSTDNRDEALYLKGQILEAKSEIRDIKGAIDAYSSLTKNYPASKLWDSANKRIIYLKRFYLEVR